MPYVSILTRRHQVGAGTTTLGGGDGVDISLPSVTREGPAAILTVTPGQRATIRRADPTVAVSVDGRPLVDESRPLAHGSKIEILGVAVLFGDERQNGTTQHVAGVAGVADPAMRLGEAEPTAGTGGVLVSLRDGRRYPVPDVGLEIGRDPHCDLVIASSAVSRWHAQVAPALLGYAVSDSSANGVFVNGVKVEESVTLARGDVIRVGPEEFRFDADVASYEPSADLLAGGAPPAAPAAPAPPDGKPSEVRARTAEIPSLPPAAAPVLATLEILTRGVQAGVTHDVTRQLSHVGRGGHNDVVLDDRSVSGTHAKLQWRDGAWYVVDMDSTNGTYVDGERVRGERRLASVTELRFGDIKATFRAAATPPSGDAGDTRKIVGVALGQGRVRSSR